jgi:hypothetical protein
MHELNALSAQMTCDERSPLEGIMFATREGFWWYDTQRYLAGGFTLDESTKLFEREPKAFHNDAPGVKTVEQDKQGAWCWYERFERPPWQGQGLCFKDGRLISGWADHPAQGKTKGDYIELELAN